MRATAATAGLIASACLLASCGSSHHAATTPTSAKPSAGAAAPRPTRARALAFARAVNLRPSDVPGFRISSTHQHETPEEQRLQADLRRCVGVSGADRAVAEASSDDFERNGLAAQQSVSSTVAVAGSSAVAARELEKLRSGRTRSCLTRYLRIVFRGSAFRGGAVGPISISSGRPPAPGTAGGFGLRISATVAVRSLRIPFYLDILGFVSGSAEVALLSSGLPQPVPAATEQRLFLLLLARTRGRTP